MAQGSIGFDFGCPNRYFWCYFISSKFLMWTKNLPKPCAQIKFKIWNEIKEFEDDIWVLNPWSNVYCAPKRIFSHLQYSCRNFAWIQNRRINSDASERVNQRNLTFTVTVWCITCVKNFRWKNVHIFKKIIVKKNNNRKSSSRNISEEVS